MRGNQNKTKIEISERSGVDYSVLAKEMSELFYSNPRYHPTRWYTPPANYSGKYVTTDRYGLRINRKTISPESAKILLFGGSTMFSTTTRNEGAIPEIINRRLNLNKAVCLNYGIGGYSTYAEIAAFCEALRRETKCEIAVFYDGVNEIAMYLEMIQSGAQNDVYAHAGYPFMSATKPALMNFISENRLYRPLRTVEFIFQTLGVPKNRQRYAIAGISLTNREIFLHALNIASAYQANVRILHGIAQAFNVKPLFIWQPDIFTTHKKLTQWEKEIILNYPPYMQELTLKVKNLVVRNAALVGYGMIDGTGWLDEVEGDHFYDYCHVSEEANRVIASKIERILRACVSASYWRDVDDC